MKRSTVTVCIVTYNQRDLIAQCIASVLEQAVDAEVHILVGDDASDDGTSEIVARLAREYPDKIEHLCRTSNIGAFENIRDLIARADSDFVARVDGDDYWLPGKLQRQLDYMLEHPDCVAVYTNAITVNENGSRIGLFNDVGDSRFDLPSLIRRGNFLNNSSVLFRAAGRQAWLEVDEPQIDYQTHLWHARHGWVGHIGEPLAAYRVNTRGSMVANMNDCVREFYWQAIQSVPRKLLSNTDYALGIADFLRRVFFRALHKRRWSLLREWAPRVFVASPYGGARTSFLTACAIARTAFKELAGLFRRGPDGRRMKVLYRR